MRGVLAKERLSTVRVVADDELEFRTDLYRGTAEDYDRYRPPYPPELIEDVRVRAQLSGSGRLLDLASGPGRLTFALAPYFAEVHAIDLEPDAIDFLRTKADELGIEVNASVGRVEDYDAPAGSFEMVSCGEGFHRLRRREVGAQVRRWLQPGGHFVMAGCNAPWHAGTAWGEAGEATVKRWMVRAGTTDRVPQRYREVMAAQPSHVVLQEAGFEYLGHFDFTVEQRWTVESMAGYAYSTSYLPRLALGDQVTAFEADLAAAVFEAEPSGAFDQTMAFAYDLFRRR